MASHASTPYFHNDIGVSRVRIGAREFLCMGALPPFDHPHVFLDMGADTEIVCPYCSTHFQHDPDLAHDAADPAVCGVTVAA